MKIRDIFQATKQTFSFEFFPPKTAEGLDALLATIGELRPYRPDFVSVTYGAMGTTRDKTIDITDTIQQRYGITAMAHLTCVGSTAEQIASVLRTLEERGVENIMALRGDPPKGQSEFVWTEGGFRHATDLIGFIHRANTFCIGAAGYPEGHSEAPSIDQDWDYLKMKVDLGADFVVTQLFLDNAFYYRFREATAKRNIAVRLIPGIMPVTNYEQIQKFTTMCGCAIPPGLAGELERVRNDAEAVRRVGVAHAVEQCRDLLRQGAPGIHFYTLNKSTATQEIMKELIAGGVIRR